MKISEAGIALIKEFEGCKLTAYPDPGSNGYPFTIGYGHTGPDVWRGKTITQEEAEELLVRDLLRFERYIAKHCEGVETTQNQFDALVSLCFNIGPGNIAKSSALKHHKSGHPLRAAASFILWNKAKGKTLGGLTRRRLAESRLYAKG